MQTSYNGPDVCLAGLQGRGPPPPISLKTVAALRRFEEELGAAMTPAVRLVLFEALALQFGMIDLEHAGELLYTKEVRDALSPRVLLLGMATDC
jgi:hypothetical protein